MSEFLQPHELEHTRLPCPSLSPSLFKHMSIESVMPSNCLILYYPFLLLPSIFPSIRVFSNASALPIRWPKYWSFSFSISSFNENTGFNIQLYNIYVCVCACALNLSILQLHNCVGWGSPYSSITSS